MDNSEQTIEMDENCGNEIVKTKNENAAEMEKQVMEVKF